MPSLSVSRPVQILKLDSVSFQGGQINLAARHQTSPDLFWLRDKSLTDLDNLAEPDELAEETIENVEAGPTASGRFWRGRELSSTRLDCSIHASLWMRRNSAALPCGDLFGRG